MVADIFSTITSAVTNFAQSLSTSVSSVVAIFWTTGENGGPTFLGTLLLIVVGVGLVYLAFRLIRGAIARI